MTINDEIRDDKLQYNINREAVRRSVSSSSKVNKHEYRRGEEILSSN